MKGARYFFRNFTALAVKEHLRSQIEGAGREVGLTPNEVELVRFAADRSDELRELAKGVTADRPPDPSRTRSGAHAKGGRTG